jgi:DNA-directed RNA polymerase subunit M/transcription elongation factor TFIIS
MHTKPMAEHEGQFRPPTKSACRCPKCEHRGATVEVWDSNCGGYEDEKLTCDSCGYVWWVDGPDA